MDNDQMLTVIGVGTLVALYVVACVVHWYALSRRK